MPLDRTAALRNAEKLLRQGKLDQAIAEYVRVVEDQPQDWNTANTLGDLYARAGKSESAIACFRRIADALSAEGFLPRANAIYKKLLKLKPDDEQALERAADIAARQGLLVDARSYLNAILDGRRARGDLAGLTAVKIRLAALDPADVEARLGAARSQVEIGDLAGAVRDLQALATDLTTQKRPTEAVIALKEARNLAPADPGVRGALLQAMLAFEDGRLIDEAQELVAETADAAANRGDWASAAGTLQDFLTQAPHHIPTLMRLVEISVDGNLDATIDGAQAQLADAYLKAGSATEARFIAEDLVERDPGNPAHIDRLRRALTALGFENPDLEMASRLTTDPAEDEDAGLRAEPGDESDATEPLDVPVSDGTADATELLVEPGVVSGFSRTVENVTLPSESGPPTRKLKPMEVDLSAVLDRFGARVVRPPLASRDLDGVFAELRDEAARDRQSDSGEQAFVAGVAHYQADQMDEAIPLLKAASRLPHRRFEAAAIVGRILLSRGQAWSAIEWLERAAQAPPPTVEAGHRLLFELADALESLGEVARALAICLELRAEAGDYEDVATRVSRLAKVQTRG